MRHFLPALSALILAAASLTAHADTFTTLNLVGDLTSGGFGPGSTITIDTTTGKISAADFTIDYNSVVYTFDKAPVLQGSLGINYHAIFDGTGLVDEFLLNIAGFSTLSDYTGGSILPTSSFNPDFLIIRHPTIVDVKSAALTPTPEPSSLVLVGTGILGLAGAARRRFTR